MAIRERGAVVEFVGERLDQPGRGLHVEASNVWLWANGVEHHANYQYQFNGASNIFAGFIQTETPYYMPTPDAVSQPYARQSAYNDPVYSAGDRSWGLRVVDSTNVFIYGAGLYSFFIDYSVDCSSADAPNGRRICQSRIVSIEGASSFQAFALSEVGVEQILGDHHRVVALLDRLAVEERGEAGQRLGVVVDGDRNVLLVGGELVRHLSVQRVPEVRLAHLSSVGSDGRFERP